MDIDTDRSRFTRLDNIVQHGQMTITSSLRSLQSIARHCKSNALDESDHASVSASEAFYSCLSGMSSKSSFRLNMTSERLPTFYPENYTVDERIQSEVFVFAKLRARYAGVLADQNWLHFAVAARRWRRFSFYLVYSGLLETGLAEKIRYGRNETVVQLPRSIAQLPRETFHHTDLEQSAPPSATGNFSADTNKGVMYANHIFVSTHRVIIEMVEDLGCPQFLESERIVVRRMNPGRLEVPVEGRLLYQHIMPFMRYNAIQDTNNLNMFARQLRASYQLRDRQSVCTLEGMVLDD